MGRTPTRKQELVTIIGTRASHLSLNKATINRLATFAAHSDDETVEALLSLLSQPDPHESLQTCFPRKVREVYEDWTEYTAEQLSRWIRDADPLFHKVDEHLRSYPSRDPESINDLSLHERFITGVEHYHEFDPNLNSEQLLDLVKIAVAAHTAYFTEMKRTDEIPMPDISSGGTCKHTWCHAVASPAILKMATSSHDEAVRILDIIDADGTGTEPHILYRLGGGPTALLSGAI